MGARFEEDELVRAIRTVIDGDAPGVRVGAGDDAAVVDAGPGELVLAADMLVEGPDFQVGRTAARDIGAKAVVVNVSDLAAMGAGARYALVSLGLPKDTELGWVVDLYGGMRAACEEYALDIVGGDVSAAAEVVVSVAVTGSVAPGRAVTRAGAKPGDRIVVTGSFGAAAGGLAISQAEPATAARLAGTPWGRALLEAHVRPVARLAEGGRLAAHGATAMIDCSDGLGRDLSRLCAASGVGARVRVSDVPVAPELEQAVAALHLPLAPLELALGGGEDFELIATLPSGSVEEACAGFQERLLAPLTEIGEIIPGEGLLRVEADGAEGPLDTKGWDHFAR